MQLGVDIAAQAEARVTQASFSSFGKALASLAAEPSQSAKGPPYNLFKQFAILVKEQAERQG